MAKTGGSKVIFVPMNLQTTGGAAMQQQIQASMTPDGAEERELEFTGGGGRWVAPSQALGQGVQVEQAGGIGSMVREAGNLTNMANM